MNGELRIELKKARECDEWPETRIYASDEAAFTCKRLAGRGILLSLAAALALFETHQSNSPRRGAVCGAKKPTRNLISDRHISRLQFNAMKTIMLRDD